MAKVKKKIYRFTGKEGSLLSDDLLQKWIQRHQDQSEIKAHFFGKDILTKILNQPGCMGIRFYYAIDDKGQKTLVLVGTDEKGQSLWSSPTGASKAKLKMSSPAGGGDGSFPCPPYC